MKRSHAFFLGVLLAAVGAGLSGCVAEVGGPGPGYYHHDYWYHDGPWMYEPHGYIGIGVHPYHRW